MKTVRLGKTGLEVSRIGMGGIPILRPTESEAIKLIQHALDLGVNFIDTAIGYEDSEERFGKAIAGHRDQVIIATKFGYVPDEATRRIMGEDASPDYIRRACEASLRRLNTNYIDLYQFHIHDYDLEKAPEVRGALESLVEEGKIRFYGWSTIYAESVRVFAEGSHFTAVQHGLNIFREDPGMVEICKELDLASVNRGPLAMGILTGKFKADSSFPEDDMRHHWGWNFREGHLAERLQQLETVREVLTLDGRTLAQAALGWIWARSESTIPIPGFKTVEQVEENAKAIEFGPLNDGQMQQINEILSRESITAE